MTSFRYSHLPIDSLDTRPFAFSFPPEPPSALKESIRKVGILTPPLVLKRSGTHILFDGHRRVLAAREAGIPRVPVAFPPECSPTNLLSLWLESQRSVRSLNPFEIARLIQAGPGAFRLSRDTIIQSLSKGSGRVSPTLLPTLPDIMNLPTPLKRHAVQRNYTPAFLVKIIRTYSPDLLAEAARLLSAFGLSENQMDLLLSWTDEIAKRDRLSPSKVLTQDPFPFLLAHPKMPSAKKRDAFLKALYLKRFPRKAALDVAVKEVKEKIETLGDLRLIPPKDLMGDRFEIRIAFRDAKGLIEALDRLKHFRNEIESLTNQA